MFYQGKPKRKSVIEQSNNKELDKSSNGSDVDLEREKLDFWSRNTKNVDVLLWCLLEGEFISLREFQNIISENNNYVKSRILYKTLDDKFQDFTALSFIITTLEDTGNDIIAQEVKKDKLKYVEIETVI